MAHRPLAEVNQMDYSEFEALLGNCVERNPMCAAAVWSSRPFQAVEELQQAFATFLEELPLSGKEGVLRLIPDLAGRLAQSGGLSDESKREQTAAGLYKITDEERAQLTNLNAKYKEKFGFPFVICGRENKFQAIIQGFETRLGHTKAEEAVTGVNEVKKICGLRIKDLVV